MPVSHSVQRLGSSWHSVRAYLSLGLEKNKSDEISKKNHEICDECFDEAW